MNNFFFFFFFVNLKSIFYNLLKKTILYRLNNYKNLNKTKSFDLFKIYIFIFLIHKYIYLILINILFKTAKNASFFYLR